jgi:hypothetical protein
MSPLEIMLKYPRRNKVWSYDAMTGRWTTEASELGSDEGKNLDPWNRPIPPVHREMRNAENELVGWVYESSVEQSLVELVVYND